METVAISNPERSASAAKPRKLKARVSNHADLLPDVDGNSASARRFRDLVQAYIVDLGGLDLISEIKLGLLRRLAAATVQAESLEADVMNGKPIDITTLCTLASTVMRLSVRLGLERVAKPVPNLETYLRAKT